MDVGFLLRGEGRFPFSGEEEFAPLRTARISAEIAEKSFGDDCTATPHEGRIFKRRNV